MAHLQPDRLRAAMAAAGLDVAALAKSAGIRADFLSNALDGGRRLDATAMRALAGPLAVDWPTLRCDHAAGQPACPGCAALNVLMPADLADAGRAFARLIVEAHGAGIADVTRWPELPAFAAARASVVAIGADMDLDDLASLGVHHLPTEGCDEGELTALAIRLATYCARGDTDTDELVGLDISGDIPSGLHIAGWDLVRFGEQDLDDYGAIPAGRALYTQSWDPYCRTGHLVAAAPGGRSARAQPLRNLLCRAHRSRRATTIHARSTEQRAARRAELRPGAARTRCQPQCHVSPARLHRRGRWLSKHGVRPIPSRHRLACPLGG